MTIMNQLRRPVAIACAALLASCGGRPSAQAVPAPEDPAQTVAQFLAAANAGDLERMASLWGDARGPSNHTNLDPPEVRRSRLQIMQRLLMSDQHRVLGTSEAPAGGRVLQVEIERGTRRFTTPFTLVRARTGGWLVNQIGLESAMPQVPGRR
jgi:hypothetical protein